MNTISPLTIELIEKQPLTALKVLAEMNASDAVDFFEVLPTRLTVSLMSKISAWSASMLLSDMAPVNAAVVLSEMDYQMTASILRVMPDANRKKLLSVLPKKLSGNLASTLTFPADTVGAKMSTSIIVMAVDQTVGEAFAELRQIKRTKTGVVYVVDGSQKLLGVVNADELLRLSNETRLGEVIDRSVAPVSARARLSSVKNLAAWDDYAHIPVVDRKLILIGALARSTFRQLIAEKPIDPAQTHSRSLLASLTSAFLNSSVGLAQVLIAFEVKSNTSIKKPSTTAAGDIS